MKTAPRENKSTGKAGKARAGSARQRSAGENGAAAWRTSSANTRTINGTGGIALWRQIAEDIEADIQTGHFQDGDRLPTEAALAERFGVNRHTLRRAIAELTGKELIEATPGRGTFVRAPRLAYPIGQSTRFSEVIADSGLEPGGKLLAHERITAPSTIAEILELSEGAQVIELEHLRVANEIPICFATTWFPAERFDGIADAYSQRNTITGSLAEFGVKTYRRKRTQVSARPANSSEREILELGRGAIVMVIDSINVDVRDNPIQASHTRFAADRVQLIIENTK